MDAEEQALEFVHRGWQHLQLQRPLAAWACWQRALRMKPGDAAATHALATLARAMDVPITARQVYRLRSPMGSAGRETWDRHFRANDMEDLDIAGDVFAELAGADDAEPAALYNEALCRAWSGRNAEAIQALDHYVGAVAAAWPEDAIEAWSLAEILRQGAGAEHLADDLSDSFEVNWVDVEADVSACAWLESHAEVHPMPSPRDPVSGLPLAAETRIFEWLDRPMPAASESLSVDQLPWLSALVLVQEGRLRFSSPDRQRLIALEDQIAIELDDRIAQRVSTPLPIPLMDLGVGTFRIPPEVDEATRRRLTREAVERFFEDHWIHQARFGLAAGIGSSPLSPAEAAQQDDPATRAKLAGIVNVREALGQRPGAAAVYEGYPFDRLRKRLGLDLVDPASVDPTDVSCMNFAELEDLDPQQLELSVLRDAQRSALGLDALSLETRFAHALARRSR
jgi:hypothetical protein